MYIIIYIVQHIPCFEYQQQHHFSAEILQYLDGHFDLPDEEDSNLPIFYIIDSVHYTLYNLVEMAQMF